MGQTSLSEISRCKIPVSKGDVPSLSWGDSPLTIVTEKTVSILKLSNNLHCMDKKIDWQIKDIPCPKTSPATSLFTRQLLKQQINNLEYTQMMLDPALWPHSVQLMEEMACVASIQWSTKNFLPNHNSAIGVLNNIGNIELHAPTSCGYSSFLNMSSVIECNYKDKRENSVPRNMEEAKQAAYAVETCAFCWGTQCYNALNLVTAQKNGDIYFWQLTITENRVNVEELVMQHSEAGEIITMQWVPISDDVFLLFVGNIFGQLYTYKYQWENRSLKLINCDCPWPHKDRMVIKYLKYRIIEDKIVLICNKHRHLLVLLVDESGSKISEYLNNLSDYKITVITESNNLFYAATINGKIYTVSIDLLKSELSIQIEEMTLKENLVNHDLCGLAFSKNNVICALGIINRKIQVRKENLALDMIFFTQEESHLREMALLLENPTRKLTDYWDCIEVVRCKAMKLKILPEIDYNLLYFNDNIYMIKLYRILLICYLTLDSILKNKSAGCLPETSLEVVTERILVLHAKNLVSDVNDKMQNSEMLSDIDTQSYAGAVKYIQYYCMKYKKNVAEFIPSGTSNIQKDLEYTCQCCDENLEGFSCKNGHINIFCGLTFTLIESDNYLSCDACGLTAREELLPQNPMCLFCDLYLNSYY